MKGYEILYILKPHLGEEKYKEINEKVKSWITNNEGEILLFNEWGTKELAGNFANFSQGYYVQCQFNGTANTVREIRSQIKVSEDFVRDLLVTLDSIYDKSKKKEEAQAKG